MALTVTLPTSEDSIKWQDTFIILYVMYIFLISYTISGGM